MSYKDDFPVEGRAAHFANEWLLPGVDEVVCFQIALMAVTLIT